MTDILNGNLYEVMRMVLPEHRQLMNQCDLLGAPRKQPELTDDAWDEIQYILSEAIEERQRVRIILFGQRKDTVMEGVPAIVNGRLVLESSDWTGTVECKKVMKVIMV